MIKYQTTIKIRYAETDQMGYVHHSRYAFYLEEARMDLFWAIGLDYTLLEKEGIIMPVVEMETRFSSPLYFGDTITVETEIQHPWDTKLVFHYRIYNQHKRMVSRAKTSLVLAEKKTGKLVSDPQQHLECLTRALLEVGI